jgi:nucleoside-diphosphate-sugar epimerase
METGLGVECPPVPTLLTGVGYIGAALVRRLAERLTADRSADRPAGWTGPLVAVDNCFSTSRQAIERALPDGVRFIEGDVSDPSTVERAFAAALDGSSFSSSCTSSISSGPSRASGSAEQARRLTVFHLAAQPSASVAAREPHVTEQSNLVGARVLLERALAHDARVIFGGSFRVYGDDLTGTVSEDQPYGRVGDLSHLSKVYVEQLARMLGVRFVSVRLGVTYGLSPIMKTDPAFMTVPNLFCKRAVEGLSLRVLEDRAVAFIHVEDAVSALLAAAERQAAMETMDQTVDDNRRFDVVNAAPEVATIGQLATIVADLARQRGLQATVERSNGSTDHAAWSTGYEVGSRLTAAQFTPRHTLAASLGQVFDEFARQAAVR